MPRSQVRPEFDLFAFGMTIHHLLEEYYRSHAVFQKYSYEMKYLRLCAARLLDGLNHQKGISYGGLPAYSFRDTGKPETVGFVRGLRYRSSEELRIDLEKLLGLRNFEAEVPELIETRSENIQVSDDAPAIYTSRVRAIVDHPLVRRLGAASQLGLVSLVYPGATHSRLEHALGTFGVAARYIRALSNDNLDPLFRQIMSAQDVKATLLAALLHDVGQYPLAHDLEDVSSEFFSHETFGAQLLSTAAPKQPQIPLFDELGKHPADMAKEFAQLLEEEWGVPLQAVRAIINARSSEREKPAQRGSHTERLCKSLIDGPIDADKVDYLRRDSQHCNVQYGRGIDLVRLCRCITVAYHSVSDGHLLMVMGVRDKGHISAESIGWSRYAMLTQVYWHHTMRSLKSLLRVAVTDALVRLTPSTFAQVRQDFFRCALLADPVIDQDWQRAVGRGKAVGSIHPGDLRVLGWLWKHSGPIGRSAIEPILSRVPYKRLVVIYRSELTERQRRTLDRVFAADKYRDSKALREAIESSLLARVKSKAPASSLLDTAGYTPNDWAKRMAEVGKLRCLVDYPARREGSSFGLHVVSEGGEDYQATPDDRQGPNESYPVVIPNSHFRDGMRELERSISCLRIFWEPKEHLVIEELLKKGDIREIVVAEVDRYVPLEY